MVRGDKLCSSDTIYNFPGNLNLPGGERESGTSMGEEEGGRGDRDSKQVGLYELDMINVVDSADGHHPSMSSREQSDSRPRGI